MSRVTAPVSKLSRAISSTTSPVRAATPLLDSTAHTHNAGAVLMPKYAELLRQREHPDSRGLKTTHRPTPQPSLANRSKPLMQTFTTSTSTPAPSTIDAAVLPNMAVLSSHATAGELPVPLTPDNYGAAYNLDVSSSAAADIDGVSIVAADPDKVLPGTPLSEVRGIDGVDLAFVHEPAVAKHESAGMLQDLWKGMVDDVFGEATPKRA